MTNQEIIEGNRLIAEFMGFIRYFPNMTLKSNLSQIYYYPYKDRIFDEGLYTSTIKMASQEGRYINQYIGEGHHLQDMQFNKSWGWLMPVVEKIESIKDDYHGKFQVFINSNQCIIQSINIFKKRKNDYYFNEYTLGSKIESTYMAVIKFIEWYNKQTKHE